MLTKKIKSNFEKNSWSKKWVPKYSNVCLNRAFFTFCSLQTSKYGLPVLYAGFQLCMRAFILGTPDGGLAKKDRLREIWGAGSVAWKRNLVWYPPCVHDLAEWEDRGSLGQAHPRSTNTIKASYTLTNGAYELSESCSWLQGTRNKEV